MTDHLAKTSMSIADETQTLVRLKARLTSKIDLLGEDLTQLKRQAKARPHRRGGPGSEDAAKYALGSVLTLLGAGEADDMFLLGLFAHPKVMARWISDETEPANFTSFDNMIEHIRTDPAKYQWCEQWGVHLWWSYNKRLYDDEISSFKNSGRTGTQEKWRRRPVTPEQTYLIAEIVKMLGCTEPKISSRGEAFDWIHEKGGNPTYWKAPETPKDWN